MFEQLTSLRALSTSAAQELDERGFVVLPGPLFPERLGQLADAYDAAVASASAEDVRVGSSTTRISDFVNRGEACDELYVYPPLLEACCRTLGRPFRLSSLHGRTLRARSAARGLHVDFARAADGWTLVGFILMVDEFRADNGATRFLPGSHRWSSAGPDGVAREPRDDHPGQAPACGPAGSLIVFNGSVWHGHGTNVSAEPRRSIQGAFIRRDERPAMDWPARMRPETLARLGPIARYLLGV
jgi:hypothetical protein